MIAAQISSLEKIRTAEDIPAERLSETVLLRGESFSFQIVFLSDEFKRGKIAVDSALAEHITLYSVRDAVMDLPTRADADDDYITKAPGLMPDILLPLEDQSDLLSVGAKPASVWVNIRIPETCAAGTYPVCISFTSLDSAPIFAQTSLNIRVLDAALPNTDFLYLQWLHVDCIALAHNVEIYSEAHWALIDQYLHSAAEIGVSAVLTPVITPPLDTAVGIKRPCVQLVRIEQCGEEYQFDFSLLKRWIALCHKNGIRYFEISCLFSQWGLERTPNIMAYKNGAPFYLFDETVSARDARYAAFLARFLPALLAFFKAEGVDDRCLFHISDEPGTQHLENYRYAHALVTDLCPTQTFIDAISDIDFYETGLITTPVVSIDHIEPFLSKNIPNLFAYYCCTQYKEVSNRFLAMPSYRNRIIGLQLYKYNIKGFLHWGFNFYLSQFSYYPINPYITTSADGGFPSGDAFLVYPGKNGPLLSLRALVFQEALQDMRLCALLETYVGRERVIKLIDESAGMDLTFSNYPRNSSYLPALHRKIKEQLEALLK